MPFIITFVSQKGGVGKSTLARATAIELIKNKYTVKIIDLDNQQTTVVDWHQRRLENGIKPTATSVECYKTVNQITKKADDFDFLVVDAPARSSEGTYQISKISNIIIQPTGASVDDLQPAILLYHELSSKGINKDSLFMACCRIGTEAENEAAHAYIKSGGYYPLSGCIYEKASYRQAQNEGKTILETRFVHLNKNADILIQSILDNFINLVNK